MSTFRVFLSILLPILLLTGWFQPSIALAASPNARLIGETSKFKKLLWRAKNQNCPSTECALFTQPINITLNGPRGSRAKIVITSARISVPATDNSTDPTNGNHTYPILLSGAIKESSRKFTSGEAAVAATIFRDAQEALIEVAIQRPPRSNN